MADHTINRKLSGLTRLGTEYVLVLPVRNRRTGLYDKKWRKEMIFRAFLSLALAMFAQGALSQTTYSFTGTNYVDPAGLFTTDMRMTGSFTTAEPLPPNLPLTPIGPGGTDLVISATFNDGLVDYTLDNSILRLNDPDSFRVSTDADGNIVRYEIGLIQPLPPHAVGDTVSSFVIREGNTFIVYRGTCQILDGDICRSVSFVDADAVVNYSTLPLDSRPPTGVWSRSSAPGVAPVPIPALTPMGLVLMSLGMLAIVLVRRRAVWR